jgi:CRISPR-associated protein Cas2
MAETIICYDITCPRRLGKIHRYLKKHAHPLQYSVFLFTGSATQLEHCLQQLQRLMDPRHDDIRAYPLPQRGLRWSLGAGALPEGIHCSHLGESWAEAQTHPTPPAHDNPPPLQWVIV